MESGRKGEAGQRGGVREQEKKKKEAESRRGKRLRVSPFNYLDNSREKHPILSPFLPPFLSWSDLYSCPTSHSACFLLASLQDHVINAGQFVGKVGFTTGSCSHVVLNGPGSPQK